MFETIAFIVGIGITALSVFIPLKFPNMPDWISTSGIIFGVALIALAAGFYWGHSKASKDVKFADAAELRLRTFGDERVPEAISSTNIWRWYYLQNVLIVEDKESGQTKEHVLINLFVTFDKPMKVGTLLISSPDMKVPRSEVKEFNNRFAVVAFHGQLPIGTLVLTAR